MATRTPVLDKTDLFGTLPPELLEQLRGRTALARYPRGDTIFEKGDPAAHLYVVFSGRVAIVARASDDRESVLTVLGPGALFGEMSMFDAGVRAAKARALTCGLRATDAAVADAMFLDVTGRTAKRLLELAGGEADFRMPLTQEELAGMVGASRERVNKAIALFVKLGWLEISGRSRYRIVNREELEIRATV